MWFHFVCFTLSASFVNLTINFTLCLFFYISSLCADNILKCFVTRWVVDIHIYTIISHYMLQNYVVTEVLRVYKIPEWKISNQQLD